MTTPRRRPPGRYDDPRRTNRVLVVAAAVVCGALVAALVGTLYQRRNEGRLPYEVRGFVASSDAAVRVEWEVRLSATGRGECLLRARGRDRREVGRQVVPVGPADGRVLVTSYVLPTAARAVTAEVTGCRELPRSSPAVPARP